MDTAAFAVMCQRDEDNLARGRLLSDPGDLDGLTEEPDSVSDVLPRHIDVDPECVEQGLAKLVLIVIELVRRLMEHQAMRRVEAGSVSDDEIERLGETFLKLGKRMDELKAAFGLQDDDLNLNLGPLGDLM
jgi:hypothetical protein